MVKFQDIFGNFLWLALFISAGLTFIIIVQSNNSAIQPLSNNELFNDASGNISSTLTSLEDTSGVQYDQFTGEQPKEGFGSIVLLGIVSSGKTFGAVILGTFTTVIKLPLAVLGLPQTLISTIITWVIIGLIISTWLLYKLGG